VAKKDDTAKKAGKSFLSMFKRLFVRDKTGENILEEETLRTPGKIVLMNLLRNKLAIIGAIGFVSVLLFSFVGSQIFPISRTYIELTHSSIRPGRNFLNYPKELADKEIVKIVSGVSFSVALTSDGNLTAWGIECNRRMRNVSDLILQIPAEIQNANIVDIEAGSRFVICIDDEGNFYGWGHRSNGQTTVPDMVEMRLTYGGVRIVKMEAGTQWTAVLGDDGDLYVWGSRQSQSNFLIPRAADGRIVDIAAGDNTMILLLDDGTIMPIGMAGTEFYDQVPEELMDGSVRVTKIAATNRNVLAMDEDGKLYLWGSPEGRLNRMPEEVRPEDIADFSAGYKNFIVVHNDGSVVVWGANELNQLKLPKNLSGVSKVHSGFFQFYAVDENDKIIDAWGHKGYLWGSDQFGRDMFTRVIHGGRISLTVGAISVAISIFLAILVGLNAGFLGGWVDHALMRLADIFDSIPFLPIAVTLSYVIGHRLEADQRMYLIMVVIGILSWTGLARLIRAQLLLEREKDFVLAARSLGIRQRNIMIKHILPNVFNLVIVNITLGYASALLLEAGLSFLGFGVIEPTPSWGNMLTSAQESTVIQFFWWRWIIPALFVVSAALSINLVGDALREAMDPRSQER
jgi:peptide/nickel transport system permease protein